MPGHSGSVARAIHEPVALVGYRESWPSAFLAERGRLCRLFPKQLLEIEHFGSTAIPGMPAKPIIDILAAVQSLAVVDDLYEPLLSGGYTTSREFNATLNDRRWFMRVTRGARSHHLHIVESGSAQWRLRLGFRDALRRNAVLAQQYSELKLGLAQEHRNDREAYTAAKAEFVASVVGIA